MRTFTYWPFLFGIAVLTGLLMSGLGSIPFHPDESTQLFMSADFRQWITHPGSLGYDPVKRDDARQNYRLLDAPLTRYAAGASLAALGVPQLARDWDWSRTWEGNRSAGALPEPRQLFAGRMAAALALSSSLFFIFACGRALGGNWAGLLSAVFLAGNALALVHARRAMAEGFLIAGICAFLASLLVADHRPWLAGLALGLAFGAKQSALALLPVGLLAIAWSCQGGWLPGRQIAKNLVQFLLVFGLLTLLLNPVYWNYPVEAVRAAALARQELLARQYDNARRLLPQQTLETPSERLVALLAHTYLAPPMFAETGNYRAETSAAAAEYLSNPLHTLGRTLPGAGLLLGLTLFGLVGAVMQVRGALPPYRRVLILFLLGTLLQTVGLVLAVPLAWQRYAIPLVPLACLWVTNGIIWVAAGFQRSLIRIRAEHNSALS